MRKEIPPGAKISTPVFGVKWPSLVLVSPDQSWAVLVSPPFTFLGPSGLTSANERLHSPVGPRTRISRLFW